MSRKIRYFGTERSGSARGEYITPAETLLLACIGRIFSAHGGTGR